MQINNLEEYFKDSEEVIFNTSSDLLDTIHELSKQGLIHYYNKEGNCNLKPVNSSFQEGTLYLLCFTINHGLQKFKFVCRRLKYDDISVS